MGEGEAALFADQYVEQKEIQRGSGRVQVFFYIFCVEEGKNLVLNFHLGQDIFCHFHYIVQKDFFIIAYSNIIHVKHVLSRCEVLRTGWQ